MTRRLAGAAIALVLFAVTGTPSDARQSQSHSYYDKHSIGPAVYLPQVQERKYHGPGRHKKIKAKGKKHYGQSARSRSLTTVARNASMTGDRRIPARHHGESPRILPHPVGCPARRFCGCGTAQYLGLGTVRYGGLAVAANWLRFPRAEPAPGMAAARRGHVFAIVRVIDARRVLAYDPNSGRGRTRLHVRSLAGFTVVNPRGWRTARAY